MQNKTRQNRNMEIVGIKGGELCVQGRGCKPKTKKTTTKKQNKTKQNKNAVTHV